MTDVSGQKNSNKRTNNCIVARGTKALYTLSNLTTFLREKPGAGATPVVGCGKNENIEQFSDLAKSILYKSVTRKMCLVSSAFKHSSLN